MRASFALLISMAITTPAIAANTSAYTTYDLKKCRVIEKGNDQEEYAGTWGCKGFKGKPDFEIVYSEGDLRGSLTFGPNPDEQCSSRGPFNGFNSAGNTVEWRLKDGKPIAAIVRWTVSYDPENAEKHHTWLLITKFEGRNSCHMAYVQGAFPMANEKARELADQMAPGFSCGKDTMKVFATPDAKPDETVTGLACDPE